MENTRFSIKSINNQNSTWNMFTSVFFFFLLYLKIDLNLKWNKKCWDNDFKKKVEHTFFYTLIINSWKLKIWNVILFEQKKVKFFLMLGQAWSPEFEIEIFAFLLLRPDKLCMRLFRLKANSFVKVTKKIWFAKKWMMHWSKMSSESFDCSFCTNQAKLLFVCLGKPAKSVKRIFYFYYQIILPKHPNAS